MGDSTLVDVCVSLVGDPTLVGMLRVSCGGTRRLVLFVCVSRRWDPTSVLLPFPTSLVVSLGLLLELLDAKAPTASVVPVPFAFLLVQSRRAGSAHGGDSADARAEQRAEKFVLQVLAKPTPFVSSCVSGPSRPSVL